LFLLVVLHAYSMKRTGNDTNRAKIHAHTVANGSPNLQKPPGVGPGGYYRE